jgi:hypothetical protein
MACTPPTIVVGGVLLSTSDFQNAQELLNNVSSASGDPTLDAYEESVAEGNNTAGRSGVLLPNTPQGTIPGQTTLPPAITQPPQQSNDQVARGGNGTPVPGIAWSGDYDQLLSPNFKLRDFTVNAYWPNYLTDYPGYPIQTRFNNLRNLAINVAEPLLKKFGRPRINSGLRNKTSGSGLSQHVTGEAADFQFSGWNYTRYWDAAQWIKDNIQFDQFIFEHSSTTGLAWFHLSYRSTGNRPTTVNTKVMTMYRNHFSPGLKRY